MVRSRSMSKPFFFLLLLQKKEAKKSSPKTMRPRTSQRAARRFRIATPPYPLEHYSFTSGKAAALLQQLAVLMVLDYPPNNFASLGETRAKYRPGDEEIYFQ